MHKTNPHKIDGVKQEILAAVETLAAGARNFSRRLQMVMDAVGAHTCI
jgi:hypothetical protein